MSVNGTVAAAAVDNASPGPAGDGGPVEPTTTECGAEDNTGISGASAGAKSTSKAEVQLQPGPEPEPNPPPPLTTEQFRVYNRLAETMEYFHDHFRQSWKTLYTACKAGRRPSNMSLKQFLDSGLSLVRYLTAHHDIEESYLYPILARKMPSFRQARDGHVDCELVQQHRAIHEGMDVFEAYLRACRNGETEFEMVVLKAKMDAWGDVLFKHLDEEVKELGAENMRKYWTLEEVRAIPV